MIVLTGQFNPNSTISRHIANVGNMIDFNRKYNPNFTSTDHIADVGNMIV